MNTDQIMNALYLVLLGSAIGGSFIVANRDNLGKTAQQAAIWVLIFVGVIGAVGMWGDISRDVYGRQSVVSDTRIEVPRSMDGHYYLTLDIGGVPVEFVVDTGASQVVLTQEDARRIGIDTDALAYLGTATTANGMVRTAPVVLNNVTLGEIRDARLRAVVNGGSMERSLLGMTYLDRFERIEIARGQLVLVR